MTPYGIYPVFCLGLQTSLSFSLILVPDTGYRVSLRYSSLQKFEFEFDSPRRYGKLPTREFFINVLCTRSQNEVRTKLLLRVTIFRQPWSDLRTSNEVTKTTPPKTKRQKGPPSSNYKVSH